MYQINNEKFGHFLAEVRKEKQMTQKDLAIMTHPIHPAGVIL